MRSVRGILKLSLLVAFILLTYAVYFPGYLLMKRAGLPGERWRNLYMRNVSRGIARILNVRIQTEGTPPDPPFILVSNHLSYLDIVPMFINLNCTFVAKKEVRSWPVIGYMIHTMGVIFIDREKRQDVARVNRLLRSSLNRRQGIVLFPEGTTTGGDRVLPFRASLLALPAAAQIPVHYSAIQYATHPSDPPAAQTVCFYGARDPFHTHLYKLASNRAVRARVVYGDAPVRGADRKQLARDVHDRVEAASQHLRQAMGLA